MKTLSKLAFACALLALPVPLRAEEGTMKLSSASFEDRGRIPAANTLDDGQPDRSPPLAWSGAPKGTKSYALLCIDHHPVARMWVHWVIFDVPAAAAGLAEGVEKKVRLPDGSRQGRNGFDKPGWGGPKPPPGTGDHDYVFTLYALDTAKLDVPGEQPTADQLKAAMAGHILAEATLTGIYSR